MWDPAEVLYALLLEYGAHIGLKRVISIKMCVAMSSSSKFTIHGIVEKALTARYVNDHSSLAQVKKTY